ncbi:hypothetical protein EJ419_07220 [Alloscardovia theropitheci]|uniref:Uncharacterized protein n=1 Tax=Alloscardovia theropitheci TaxID=2496842 RepID=A0A4V2MTU2_9BIFI|nr:hypothetical protein [Alloscardovia theropitheci]TCD53749.1 hypothetical protein EJ419_07220 [Alloscardovia theropitheci]
MSKHTITESIIEITSTIALAIITISAFQYIITHNANYTPIQSLFALAVFLTGSFGLIIMWAGTHYPPTNHNNNDNNSNDDNTTSRSLDE